MDDPIYRDYGQHVLDVVKNFTALSITNMLASNTFVALTSLLAVSKAAYSAPSDPAAACSALASSIQIQNVTVNVAAYLPAGTNLTLSQGQFVWL